MRFSSSNEWPWADMQLVKHFLACISENILLTTKPRKAIFLSTPQNLVIQIRNAVSSKLLDSMNSSSFKLLRLGVAMNDWKGVFKMLGFDAFSKFAPKRSLVSRIQILTALWLLGPILANTAATRTRWPGFGVTKNRAHFLGSSLWSKVIFTPSIEMSPCKLPTLKRSWSNHYFGES